MAAADKAVAPPDAIDTAIVQWQDAMERGGLEACEADLATRQTHYLKLVGGPTSNVKPLDLILQAETIQCGILSMQQQKAALIESRKSLLEGAAALDTIWRRDHRAAPDKVADYPGRNRSQMLMRHDAARNLRNARQLDGWIARNTRVARATLALAPKVVNSGELDDGQTRLVQTALSDSGANDILQRIMSTIKTVPMPRPMPAGVKV